MKKSDIAHWCRRLGLPPGLDHDQLLQAATKIIMEACPKAELSHCTAHHQYHWGTYMTPYRLQLPAHYDLLGISNYVSYITGRRIRSEGESIMLATMDAADTVKRRRASGQLQ